ncbi:redoxin domain-containing protein [Sansalvadorimonas verongulae]|uniref:redoxin domain-containing protein n=1 Tax=Sansalvadorimonas verongulae TaxID=2172824 RepID=UPI0012BB7255|nr:redoxin domain-containing protein [Sansalvadorimonas verongulae]MTI11733.1 redoxin domain-containing protein [Sansalvadorimonas verongulae]
MQHTALTAGQPFPQITVKTVDGGQLDLGCPKTGLDWQLVVVYRGAHCPLCTRYLNQLNERLVEFNRLGVDVVAVSADSQEKAQGQLADIAPAYPVGFGLTIKQMQQLGLYISEPRSSQEADAPFAEPGLFVVNEQGAVQIIDIANAPFTRPDLDALLMGLGFIKNPANNYPIRGTFVS